MNGQKMNNNIAAEFMDELAKDVDGLGETIRLAVRRELERETRRAALRC